MFRVFNVFSRVFMFYVGLLIVRLCLMSAIVLFVDWLYCIDLFSCIAASMMWCYRRVLRIPYVHHVTNEDVLEQMGQKRLLLGKVQSQKLRYFGHIARHPSLENDIALGYMPGTRRQGGQRRQWIDDITDWAGKSLPEMVTLARDRRQYRQLVHKVVEAPHGV